MDDPANTDTRSVKPTPTECPENSPPQRRTRKTNGNSQKCNNYIPSYMKSSAPCEVCGDFATGLHYKIMTCEGCKGFFRRTIQRNSTYVCKNDFKCVINKESRNKCQACRFKRCVEVGMNRKCVLTENQRTEKRKLIEENRQRRNQMQNGDHQSDQVRFYQEEINILKSISHGYDTFIAPIFENNVVNRILCNEETKIQVNFLPMVVWAREDIKKWSEISKSLIYISKYLVQFWRRIKIFFNLNFSDQIEVIKNSVLESIILCVFQNCNQQEGIITFPDGLGVLMNCMTDPGDASIIHRLFILGSIFQDLCLNNVERALMIMILIYQRNDQYCHVLQRIPIEFEHVCHLFRKYEIYRKTEDKFDKIMDIVPQLRDIGEEIYEKNLKYNIWDIQELPPSFLDCIIWIESNRVSSVSSGTPITEEEIKEQSHG